FNGVGRLHGATPFANPTSPVAATDAALMNFQYHPADGFLRDAERPGWRNNATQLRTAYTGGFNVPYTYPDHNNFYLAAIAPAPGAVVTPSFHREYLFGRLDNANNPNWTSQEGKYLTLRPTRAQHPNFPLPSDRFGDVKNLDNAPGGNDSIWIDIGAPAMTAAHGCKFKMLVAPLILELDGRVDLNVVGNIGNVQLPLNRQFHRSNQGWGHWEINPSVLLNVANAPNEWRNLFFGAQANAQAAVNP